jgi:hypothetical protein
MSKQEIQLPVEIQEIANGVSVEKRTEVQNVLNKVFNGVAKMRDQLNSVVVEDENDKVNMKLANTIRLGVRAERLEAEKTFDAKRSEVQLQMSSFKTEDALWLKAKQTMQILTKELEENARWKEETSKRIEAEKFENEMQARLNRVQKFNPEITIDDVRNFSNENFEMFFSGVEKTYNDKIEAEKQIEIARIEAEKKDLAEREAQRLENERLKVEAAAREKAEHELKAQQQAEADRLAQIELNNQAELSKGDADKVKDLISDLEVLKNKYSFKSAKSNKMYQDVNVLIDKVINHITK